MATVILGGGVTGLAAGLATGGLVLEAESGPGGLSRSYSVDGYRFERGGGHWIFGGDREVLALLDACSPLTSYERDSAVHFLDRDLLVPFPIQHHVGDLGPEIVALLAAEPKCHASAARTLRDWLLTQFGPTLCDAFFFPFHELYTAGLYRAVAPQDGYKSPGVGAATAGYNASFRYPRAGLDAMTRALAEQCNRVEYEARVVSISTAEKLVTCADGRVLGYDTLVSTLPLTDTLRLSGTTVDVPADPYTSVLVVNIGAERGPRCPDAQWVYVPVSASGFHRVGFYSNVDRCFLPAGRGGRARVALYVERAYPAGARPSADAESAYVAAALAELREIGYIGEIDVVDATWIEVAYTWCRPDSTWVADACRRLVKRSVHPIGRYGRWRFQGIADSVRDGLALGRPA